MARTSRVKPRSIDSTLKRKRRRSVRGPDRTASNRLSSGDDRRQGALRDPGAGAYRRLIPKRRPSVTPHRPSRLDRRGPLCAFLRRGAICPSNIGHERGDMSHSADTCSTLFCLPLQRAGRGDRRANPSFAASFSRCPAWETGRTAPDRRDFAEEDAVGRQRRAGQRRDQRRGGGKVGGRFVDPQAAGDVEIDVMLAEPQRRHGPPARRAPSTGAPGPSRRRRGAACRARWARPAPGFPRARAACPPCPRTRRRRARRRRGRRGTARRGCATSLRPAPVISKTPISSVGPKRFFTARRMRNWCPPSPSKESDGVDHVLDDAGAGDLAVLGDVADQDHAGAGGLGVADERLRRSAHLRDGSRRGVGARRSTWSGWNR